MPDCSWNDCEEEAVTNVSVGRGEETCETCGHTETKVTKFWMCQDHYDTYEAQGVGNNLILLVDATGEMVA